MRILRSMETSHGDRHTLITVELVNLESRLFNQFTRRNIVANFNFSCTSCGGNDEKVEYVATGVDVLIRKEVMDLQEKKKRESWEEPPRLTKRLEK